MVALGVGVRWALKRYTESLAWPPFDFENIFLPAANRILSGGSPFELGGYVHSPVAALSIAALKTLGADPEEVWLALITLAAFLGCVAWTIALTQGRAMWLRGSLLAVAFLTVFTSRALERQLWLGQYDTWILLGMGLALLCHLRGWRVAAGFLLGVGALLKLWPAIFLVVLLNRNFRTRGHVVGVAAAALSAIALCLPFGGFRGVFAMLSNAFALRDQGVIAYSGAGLGKALFMPGGQVAALLLSPALSTATAVAVTLAALALVVVTVWRAADPSWCLVVVMTLSLLIVPVSHISYQLLSLPLLWLVVATFLGRPWHWSVWAPLLASSFWWWELHLQHPIQAPGYPPGFVTAQSFGVQMIAIGLHGLGGAISSWVAPASGSQAALGRLVSPTVDPNPVPSLA